MARIREPLPWIQALKVGDKVVLDSSRHGTLALRVVEKVTPSGRVTVGGHTFYPDGREYGVESYHCCALREATPELVLQAREQADFRRLSQRLQYSTKWPEIPLQKLREICAILDRPEAEEPR